MYRRHFEKDANQPISGGAGLGGAAVFGLVFLAVKDFVHIYSSLNYSCINYYEQ